MGMRVSFHCLPAAVAVALLIPALAPMQGCKPGAKGPAGKDSSAVPKLSLGPENFAVAIEGRIETGPSISGTLTPRQKATVRAQLSGAVLATFVEQGESVGGERSLRASTTAPSATPWDRRSRR
jgi:hypothetical protein